MTETEKLLADIRALDPPAQLRLAGDLLENKRPRLALAVAKKIVVDLEILHLQGKLG